MLLTVRQAAEALNVSPSLIYGLCAQGALRHERIGSPGKRGTIRIPEEAIQDREPDPCWALGHHCAAHHNLTLRERSERATLTGSHGEVRLQVFRGRPRVNRHATRWGSRRPRPRQEQGSQGR